MRATEDNVIQIQIKWCGVQYGFRVRYAHAYESIANHIKVVTYLLLLEAIDEDNSN